MINDIIPDDILKMLINIQYSTVCKYWYNIWVSKRTKLTVRINRMITKSSINSLLKLNNIYNNKLIKFTDLTSLSLANNNTITNTSWNSFKNLTD